jgi:hypothetical protein
MEVSPTWSIWESPAVQGLGQFVRQRQQAWQSGPPSFEQFEHELLAAELAGYDVEAEHIEVAGGRYHPVWEDIETYLTGAGEVRVKRHLYRPAGHTAKSICPLALRLGIVDGYWTPRAARQGVFVMAQMTPGDAAALFAELGAMTPSRSSLERLPRELSARWEAQRQAWETALRAQETVPDAATSVALSVLQGEMEALLALRPDLRRVHLADGAEGNRLIR